MKKVSTDRTFSAGRFCLTLGLYAFFVCGTFAVTASEDKLRNSFDRDKVVAVQTPTPTPSPSPSPVPSPSVTPTPTPPEGPVPVPTLSPVPTPEKQ